jgi:hypothetical protein
MKHIVLADTVRAATIRPPDTFAKLRDVSIEDARRYFADPAVLRDVPCPACDSGDRHLGFEKYGFSFQQCRACGSVYVSPRPNERALARYFEDSEAAQLRVKYFTEESAAARLYHVVESRIDWIAQLIERNHNSGKHFVDYGTLYPSLFREVERLGWFEKLYSVDPPGRVATRLTAADVVVGWPSSGTARGVTAFEQLEHQAAPRAFLEALHELLAVGAVLFVTTRTISGFDLQTLWDHTPYIFVPDHLNLLSVEGLTTLFESAGFELIELSTPGQLDVEMVLEAAKTDDSIQLPCFVKYLLGHRNAETLADFQGFLQRNRLSSHVRVAARRV